MRFNSTLVGSVVLACVAAGVFYARSQPSMMERNSAVPSSVGMVPTGMKPDDDVLPDATMASASAVAGDVRITLSLLPQPPVAFGKTRVRVRASSEAEADKMLALEGGRVTFEMSMPMGDHRYSLVPGVDGWQEAEVILPLCPSGKRRWYATVVGTVAGRPRTARFRLDLEPPG